MMEEKTDLNTREAHRAAAAQAFACGLLLLVVAGCNATPMRAAPLSESAVRLDLPLVRQDALYDCGLASISALCQYWGIDVPDEQRVELARTAEDNAGLSGDEVRAALEALGLEVYLFTGSLDRTATGIYAHVDAGRPPLVMVSNDAAVHHYELVLGYDDERSNVILLDPEKGEVVVPVTVFDRRWALCQRFTLLACPREEAQLAASQPRAVAASPPFPNNTSLQRK